MIFDDKWGPVITLGAILPSLFVLYFPLLIWIAGHIAWLEQNEKEMSDWLINYLHKRGTVAKYPSTWLRTSLRGLGLIGEQQAGTGPNAGPATWQYHLPDALRLQPPSPAPTSPTPE